MMHLTLALLLTAQQPAVSSPTDSAHVVIVATTDVHGRLLGWDYVHDNASPGGLSRVAAVLGTLRTQYPSQVVLVDAGDLLQGTPLATYFARVNPQRPNPLVDALSALQYDAATPGEHDMDFGLDVLRGAAEDATYRYVSANITAGPRDSLLFPATLVVQRGSVRIGITGLTTPGAMVWNRRQLAGQGRVRSLARTAPAALAQLERAGVDLTIVLAHSGLGGRSSYDTTGVGPENDAAALAALPHKPDLVVVGHSHRVIRDSVLNGVHFVQPQAGALSVSVVHVWFARPRGARERWRVASIRADLVPLDTVGEVVRFARRMEQASDRARSWAAEPIGTAGPGFDARYGRARDTPLFDFINEVQRRRAGADLASTSTADLGTWLPDGAVRHRDVAGIYPFEYSLVAIRITGRQLRAYLEHTAAYYATYNPSGRILSDTVPGEVFDVVSGASYEIDLTQPVGARITGLAVEGRAVAPTDSFTLATSSYRAAGGGGYDMLRGARVVYDRGESIRDLLEAEIRQRRTLAVAAAFAPRWSILPPAREAVLAAFAPAHAVALGGGGDSTVLRVLAIADFHGALEPQVWPWSRGRPVGGAAALRPWLDSLARDCGCTGVRLDAGDEWQGTPVSNFFHGRPVVTAFNTFSLDAAAIGMHEFDWTVDTLRARLREARYQFVSANITDSASGATPEWLEPWTLVSRGGVKVAVIGLTTTSTPGAVPARNVAGLAFGDGAEAVRRVLPDARRAADFVIVLAHAGMSCDSAPCGGEALDLARQLDSGSVDLIVAGHTHQRIDTVVNGIPLVEPGSSGNTIAVVDFLRTSGRRREVRSRLETPYADLVKPVREIATAIDRARRTVDSLTNRTVATLSRALNRVGDEYPLGRLIADAFRNIGRADVALVANSGIGADLRSGRLSYAALFEALPFQNRLFRVTLTGEELQEVLEHALETGTPDVHVSGLQVWCDPGEPEWERIYRVRMLKGRKLDPERSYTLVVPEFVAEGGLGYTTLPDLPRTDIGLLDIDAIVTYLSVLPQPVAGPSNERFHHEEQ